MSTATKWGVWGKRLQPGRMLISKWPYIGPCELEHCSSVGERICDSLSR